MQTQTDIGHFAKAKAGLWVLLLGFFGFVLWASLAPLDQGVPLNGTITIEGERKAVQHPYGGIVDAIHIHEGEQVQAGQLLITLNPTESAAQLESLSIQNNALESTIKRLRVESQTNPGKTDLQSLEKQSWQADQIALFAANWQTRQAEIQSLEENLQSTQRSARLISDNIQLKQQQLAILSRKRDALEEMSAKGYVARMEATDIERQTLELQTIIGQDQIQASQYRAQSLELTQKIRSLKSQHQAEAYLQINELEAERAKTREQLENARFIHANREIKSPVAGYVLGLQVFTIGSVVQAGGTLLEVAPTSGALEVSARMPVDLIDQVLVGHPVNIRFSALKTAQTLELSGTVKSLGADKLSDQQTGIDYYPIKIGFSANQAAELEKYKIQTGMPVELLVKTGERTLMNYLFKPLTDRFKQSLTEY